MTWPDNWHEITFLVWLCLVTVGSVAGMLSLWLQLRGGKP